MATLNVSDEFKAEVEARAVAGGYASATEYLEALVESETDYGAPEHLRVRTRERLAELVLESLARPARETTAAELAAIRAEMVARHTQSKAG